MSMPRERPAMTSERHAARRCGGARSPTRGSMSWGVTVVMPHMKEMPAKEEKFGVRQRASHYFWGVWDVRCLGSKELGCGDIKMVGAHQRGCKKHEAEYIGPTAKDIA